MRESVIEDYLVKRVREDMGGRAIKLTSSSLRALPDRLIILPHGKISFVECKAPGRRERKDQAKVIRWLKGLGHIAVVIDSRPRVDAFVDAINQKLEEGW